MIWRAIVGLSLIPLILAHKHSDVLTEEQANAPVDAILWIHIVLQATVWGLIFPIGMVLGLTRSRWHVPLQVSEVVLDCITTFYKVFWHRLQVLRCPPLVTFLVIHIRAANSFDQFTDNSPRYSSSLSSLNSSWAFTSSYTFTKNLFDRMLPSLMESSARYFL